MTPKPLLGRGRDAKPSDDDRAWLSKVRQLNDNLREAGRGGMILISEGLAAHSIETVNLVHMMVACFYDFTPENDLWGEHDGAVLAVQGLRVIWRIEYYDRSRTMHSRDPSNPKVTTRVMKLMLEGEECL